MENPAEVQEVRNKLRMMKLPQDDILNTVRRQQRAIHKQKQANDTIRNEIVEYEAQIANLDRDIQNYKNNEELQKLQTYKKNLSNKLSILSADLAAEEQKRKKLEEDVSKANSKAGGLFQQSKENEELQAKLRTIENRLDKALVRYNNNLTKLSGLRSQIDELRKDRFTFREVIRNTENDRQKKDQEIGNLISNSNDAYSRRDRLKMDLVQLKQAEAEDIKNFEEEYTRLSQQIEGQRITQNRPRDQQQTVPSLSSQIGSQSDQQEEITALTEQYNSTIQRTLDLLEFKEVQELFDEADNLERENFSLFNFVVENGAKRSKLQEEIEGLDLQHDSLLAQVEVNDAEQKEELDRVTSNIKVVNSDLTSAKEEKEKTEAEFTSVYTEIENLFNNLECNWDESPDGKSSITPQNAMFCLSSIESAIAEMMNNVVERAKVQYNMRGIQDFTTIISEDRSDSAGIKQTTHAKAISDKEAAAAAPKAFEGVARPMSIEEMRAMLG